MTVVITWLDHSERDRRKVLEAIERLGERDTRDEIGIASIRDAFADYFFPGTSVLMTRARYFLFVPWLYQRLDGRAKNNATAVMRNAEFKLIDALGNVDGNIGRRAKSQLKRTASSIYWIGLASLGIRRFRGSQPVFERTLGRRLSEGRAQRDDDGAALDGARVDWDPGLPEAPNGFPKNASLDLTAREARYLSERIRLSQGGTLLDLLGRSDSLPEVDFPWQHPAVHAFPGEIRTALAHAENFSLAMHGAALLYNLLLANARSSEDTDLVERCRSSLSDWRNEIKSNRGQLDAWNVRREEFWGLLRKLSWSKPNTRRFVDAWLDSEPWRNDNTDSDASRRLVRQREAELKGSRARLGNARALELWSGESLAVRNSFRWPSARRLLDDIRTGLSERETKSDA